MDKVSVIIPFFSGVDWLCEAVESVIKQTYINMEIIVINDGSTEDVEGFLSKYGRFIRYYFKENGGSSTARNMGIEFAEGDYVAFLDSDDLWLPEKLEKQVEAMRQFPEINWSYCSYSTFGIGEVKHLRSTDSLDNTVQRYYRYNISTPSVMIRKNYLQENPHIRFNNELLYGEDSLFWLTINSENSILAIPDELVKVRMRGSNATKCARIQLIARSEVWMYRKRNKDKLIDNFKISWLYKLSNELCISSNKILEKNKKYLSERNAEMLAKALFFVPWSLNRLDRIIYRRNYE